MAYRFKGMKQLARGAGRAARKRFMHVLQRSSMVVLVDAENISAKYFPQVIKTVRQMGRVQDVRVYGPATLLNSEAWSIAAVSCGAKRVPCAGCRAGKNSADIRMVVDAMDLMASKRAVTFVLVSDDSDFTPLARRLREEGRYVIGIGRLSRNNQYRKAFDEFMMVDDSGANAQASHEMTAVSSRMLDEASRECGIDVRVLWMAVKCARRGAEDGTWCSLSDFGTLIREEQPSFSTKKYGCKNLTAFVAKTGLFDMRGEQPHTYIRVRAA